MRAVIGLLVALLLGLSLTARADQPAELYLGKVEQRIMATWKIPPKSEGLKVTLRFTLARNGGVSFVRVEKSSGNDTFDDSAVQAVKKASPFPTPPESFPIGDLRIVLDPMLPLPTKGRI